MLQDIVSEMEVPTEIEVEITPENTGCEIYKENSILETIPYQGNQIEMQIQENNVVEEQSDFQEEVVVNKLNLKQQIDIQKLILEECKQYINIEEQKKIMESAMNQQITKLQESIQLLQTKIKNEKNNQRTATMESNNENRKLLEIKFFTVSTKEFTDVLRSYVEGLEQQMDKLKFEKLQNKVSTKYEESCRMINDKNSSIEKMNCEIRNLNSEFNVTEEKLKCQFNTMLNNMRSEEECHRRKIDSLLQRNQQITEKISEIDQYLNDKQENDLKSSAKMNEIFSSKISQFENWKSNSLRIQELELKRNDLSKSIEYSSSSIDTLMEDLKLLERERLANDLKLQTLQKDTPNIFVDGNIEEMKISDMEGEHQFLTEELRMVEEQFVQSKLLHDEMVNSSHKNEVELLRKKNVYANHRQQLLGYQNSNSRDWNAIQELKSKVIEAEEEVDRKIGSIKIVEEELVTLDSSKQQLESTLEKLQQEIRDRNDQLNYQRNTLQVHLESKLKDLEEKLKEAEIRNKEEKEKFTKIETINKNNNEEYNRLRNMYFMLKTSSSKFKSPYPQRHGNRGIEKIEAEVSLTETSPKSILKSPGQTRPTKNVQFVGVPSSASSNSTEMVNTNNLQEPDPFDQMRSNMVPKPGRRIFD